MHCKLKSYKALGTPLQLYGNGVIAQQPFKLLIISIVGHLGTVSNVVGPLQCDASSVVMP